MRELGEVKERVGMIKLSVVTPCYNQVTTLEATIRSVLSQGYPNLEYIIIDGGSSDGTVDIIRKYAPQLHFWCSEPDEGQYAAINKGFRHSTGEVMAWLNGDDFYIPGALRAVGSIFGDLAQVEWLTSLAQVTADGSGACIDCNKVPGFSRDAFLDGAYLPGGGQQFFSFIQQESTFWRRSLWERAGPIDPSYALAGDFDLWSRFFRCTSRLYCTPAPLGCFRYLDGQKSGCGREVYLEEGLRALSRLRREVNWKRNRVRDLVVKLGVESLPYLPILTNLIFQSVLSLYSYSALAVVRRKRGRLDAHWQVQPLRYFRWPLGSFESHFCD